VRPRLVDQADGEARADAQGGAGVHQITQPGRIWLVLPVIGVEQQVDLVDVLLEQLADGEQVVPKRALTSSRNLQASSACLRDD
jgi:hypothetical protein